MTRRQLQRRGITSPRVLAAMRTVPREEFVPARLRERAYADMALPIECDQSISQPYIVALMAEALDLRDDDRVLEVGTGSGYAAAILGRLAGEVHTIERHVELARGAAERLRRLGCHNVHVHVGDGTAGLPPQAPFDAISVAAGGIAVPDALRRQLRVGGRLVIPIGEPGDQELLRLRRLDGDRFATERLGAVRFVPLVRNHRDDDPEAPRPRPGN